MDDPFEVFKKWNKMNPLSRNLRANKGTPKHSKPKEDSGEKNEYKSNLFKKLKHRSKYINMEYEETKEIFERARHECLSSIMAFCEENPDRISPLTTKEEKEKEISKEKKEIFQSNEIKSVYRQIVLQTHPDKSYGEEDEEMTDLYMAAIEAKENCDFHVLMDVATDLRIDAKDLSMEQLEFLEKEIDQKEDKIKKMRKDFMWQWYHSNNKKRAILIERICPLDENSKPKKPKPKKKKEKEPTPKLEDSGYKVKWNKNQ